MKSNPFLCSLTLRIALPAFLSFGINQVKAAGPVPTPSVFSTELSEHKKSLFFEENKGQIPDKSIKYYGNQGSVILFCKPGKISFVFTRIDKESNQISEATGKEFDNYSMANNQAKAISPFGGGRGRTADDNQKRFTTSRMDFILIGSNSSAIITPSNKQDYFENFYTTGNADSGIAHVNTYKTITYKDIYSHIDLILSVAKNGIEYSFLVHPGGKVSDIQLRWDGAENAKPLANGGIRYGNTLGNIEESAPRSFAEGRYIKSSFTRDKESYGFKVGKYDQAKDLIIDPTLVWATYYGGENIEEPIGITTDSSGNVYVTGYTWSFKGIATSGAWQTKINGNPDVYLARFSAAGKLLWGTYFGGSQPNESEGICLDHSGGVYIAGNTESTSGIATSGAWQSTTQNGAMFIAKFSISGKLIWGTYLGNSVDGSSGICCDKLNNLYITGTTGGNSNFFTIGSYQGGIDAFLAKISPKGAVLWGAYIGGGGHDEGVGLSTDNSDNIYLTGSTNSTGLATSGAYQTAMEASQALYNAYLAKYNSNGSLQWCTYYGDSYGSYGLGVSVNPIAGDIYITGYTPGNNNIATSGAYQTSNAGGDEAYLAKFSTTGSLVWGTFYGGIENDYSYSVSANNLGDIYIAGFTYSPKGIATIDAYQPVYPGGINTPATFLAKFNRYGKLTWATYYGGKYTYILEKVCADSFGNAYLYGLTEDTSGIATPGAYQTAYGGGEDAFIAKFGSKIKYDAGIYSILNRESNNCTDSESVKVQLINYGTADLDSVNIFFAVNNKVQKQYYWKGDIKPDSFTIVNLGNIIFNEKFDSLSAWTSMPDGFKDSVPSNDTSYLVDTVYTYPYANTGGNHAICQGNSITLGTSPTQGHTYSWLSIPSGFSSSVSNPVATPSTTTTYYLTETVNNTTCRRIDSATITVNPLPAAITGPPKSICQTDSVSIGLSAVTGNTYSWSSNPYGFVSANARNTVSPATTTIYYLTETITATGCYKEDSVQVTVHPLPLAKTVFNQSICNGDSIAIGYASASGDTYQWTSSPAGYNNTSSNPIVKPKSTTVYILKETTAFGCTKNGSVDITVNPIPPDPDIRTKDSVCLGQSVKVQFHPSSYINYVWSSIPVGYSSNDSIINVSPIMSTEYVLTETIPSTDCFRNDTIKIKVNPIPVPVIKGDTVMCGTGTAIYQVASASGDLYSWSVTSGKINSGQKTTDLSVAWNSINSGQVKLVETNRFGCSNSDSLIVNVSNKPVAGFYFQDVCLGNPIYFQDSSTDAKSWSWNFGDSTTSNVENVFHVYSHSGSYTVVQIVKNSVGCADTFIKTAVVKAVPDLQWIIKKDTGRTILYSVSDNSYKQYQWNFGDSMQSSSYHGSHYYSKDDIYDITLTVTNNIGCSEMLDTSITMDYLAQGQTGIFPNPFVDHLNVNYVLSQNSEVSLALYDAIGKRIHNFFDETQSPGYYTYDITQIEPNLAPAIYFMKLIIDGHVTVVKLVKEN